MDTFDRHTCARWHTLCVLSFALVTLPACTKSPQATKPPAIDVEVAQVEQKDVPIYGQWVGTLDGLVNAEVMAQVTGYLLRQGYKEGSFVKKGQLLFQIDPRPFQATLDQAKAQVAQGTAGLASAQANQRKSQLDVEKYTPLVKRQAASQQDLDNAVQTQLANEAAVETAKAQILAAQAAVESAQINLGFTRITSPIDGVAGLAQNQVGDLVGTNSTSPITTVSTVDPIKVYFTISETEYLTFARRFPGIARLGTAESPMPLQLILADGTTYAREGRVEFTDREVDQNTGTIRVAALFPNPDNLLRPGGYGQVRAVTTIQKGALLVPQRAVAELQGNYQIAVVDGENMVSIRNVKVGDRVGALWVITDGLKPGERVVAEGVEKVRPGVQVNPKPFAADRTAANR